ncbi:MAG TPA: hypothetical protein VGM02_05150 [Acidobacteriaceae bacterium]
MLARKAEGKYAASGQSSPRVSRGCLLLCGVLGLSSAAVCQTAPTPPASSPPISSPTTPAPPTSSPATGPIHAKHHKKQTAVAKKEAAVAPVAQPAPPPPPTVAPSLFQQPAVPATVTARNNELMVNADNSSLAQILHQVSSATGMQLDGLGGDERVFGNFGPGAPREVLTSLLNGTSYNIMMVGDLPNGAPRELLLTSKAAGEPPAPAAKTNEANGNADASDDAGNDDSEETPPMQYTPPPNAPGTPPRGLPQLRMQHPPQ